MPDLIKEYRERFLASLPADSPYASRPWSAESWGDHPALADELGTLIAAGTKTATCSAVWEYAFDGDPLPEVGHLTIVLNGRAEPLCVIETTEISFRPYHQVDAQFAFDEGEGDRSLAYWRAAHRSFFGRVMQKIGRQFDEDIPLVCERFKLIYRPIPHNLPITKH